MSMTILGDFMNNIKLRVEGVEIHGSNPIMDGWQVVKMITQHEAAALARVPSLIKDKEYLWANHGYLVLELLDSYSLDMVKQGMTGVYLCDGQYMLIEKA